MPALPRTTSAPPVYRPVPKIGSRLSIEWHNPKTEVRGGMDRVQGQAFALSSRPEDRPAEFETLWAALGGPGCGFKWCSMALEPPPKRHTPQRRGQQ
ncbi:hypothetical protein [Deinococcus saxicola]|uniref:hypothetical protein n=1 Tax=Deinococcus saxicola TaxID=249406 RepID=UPI0039EE898E